MLRNRFLKKWPLVDDGSEPGFTLGKWGVPVNILAVLWGGAMTLNLIWPRPEIYNSVPPFEWYLQWGGVLFVAAVTGGGALLYRVKIRHQTGVLAEHAAATTAHPMPGLLHGETSASSRQVPAPVQAAAARPGAEMGNGVADALPVQVGASGSD
jgi:hypothetical protein